MRRIARCMAHGHAVVSLAGTAVVMRALRKRACMAHGHAVAGELPSCMLEICLRYVLDMF